MLHQPRISTCDCTNHEKLTHTARYCAIYTSWIQLYSLHRGPLATHDDTIHRIAQTSHNSQTSQTTHNSIKYIEIHRLQRTSRTTRNSTKYTEIHGLHTITQAAQNTTHIGRHRTQTTHNYTQLHKVPILIQKHFHDYLAMVASSPSSFSFHLGAKFEPIWWRGQYVHALMLLSALPLRAYDT